MKERPGEGFPPIVGDGMSQELQHHWGQSPSVLELVFPTMVLELGECWLW